MKQRSGRDASSHHEVVFTKWFSRSGFHEVVLHGLMPVTGSQRLNGYACMNIKM
ncbi:MAG: hypothetical protein HFJ08_07335 [Lachnospiraceae bacterium]|nr:hypothetical protein [Lachnospiraceae bacterium]